MPSIYQLKPAFQRLLFPVCRGLHGLGITPNQVTLFTLFLSVAAGVWLWLAPDNRLAWLAVPVLLFVRMALNALDGMLAKQFNLTSALGAVLNEVGDVLADAALFLPFACLPGARPELVMAVVVLGMATEVAGLSGLLVGAGRGFQGPFGKSDRAFFFGLLGLLHGVGILGSLACTCLLGIAVFLALLTLVNRCRAALIPTVDR
jgi:CDP-diacylglycerol--glycerol-3-phosphate 3-phosphatidyltransferase